MAKKSLSDKINASLALDSESEDESEDTAKIENFDEYVHNEPSKKASNFRKRNVKFLAEQSAKYKGKITSRKELNLEEQEEEEEEEESSSSENGRILSQRDAESEVDSEDSEESGTNSPESEEDHSNAVNEHEQNRHEAEIRKGVCVKNQIHIWERLLEMRIRIQSLLNKSNQLPSTKDNSYYATSVAKETAEKTCHLLKNLNELKFKLTCQFGELRTSMKRSFEGNLELSNYASGAPPLKRIAMQLENQHDQMRSYRNSVLLKWDDRTKLSTPGAGFKKKKEEFDVVRKIESALQNKESLVAKSREIKQDVAVQDVDNSCETEQLEKKETTSRTDVYDDSDFYYQQLRELIEYKTSSSSNVSEMSKQVVELQKLRQKMKKKVDTRASKGRKLRYVVHNKLVNFMAPDDTTTWSEESKDELFKSLFAT